VSHMMKYSVIGLILLSAHTASADAAAKKIRATGLESDKVQHIQAIGQTVLTAKRNAPANPDLEIMRQRITELRAAVIKLNGQVMNSSPLSLPTEGATLKAARDTKVRVQTENEVRNVLEKVRDHRAALRRKIDAAATGEDHSRERNVIDKVGKLEDELDQILRDKPEERGEKLRKLAERLTAQRSIHTGEPPERTPTITTITQHRR